MAASGAAQEFDLVVINVSSALTSNWVGDPWNLSADHGYRLSLQAGLNNLLSPREQFLQSPFGEAILGGETFPYLTGHPTPPILSTDTSAQTILNQSFRNTFGLMWALQAYWQNRSFATGAGSFGSQETGVSNTSSSQVRVVAVTSPPANNTGGLPSEPTLLNSTDPTAAVQSILTLNITSTATLDLLLAGLLDNNTDGVNGTLLNVTSEIHVMGLSAPILNGLANASIYSQGIYPIPQWRAPPTTPTSSGFWGTAWNAAVDIVTNPAGIIESAVGIVYSWGTEAQHFLVNLPHEAEVLGGEAIARTVAALRSVAEAIITALALLIEWLWDLISGIVTSALRVFTTPFINAFRTWVSAESTVANESVAAYSGVNVVQNEQLAATGFSAGLALPAAIALALTFSVVVALGILTPFDIEAAEVMDFVLPLLATILGSAISLLGPGSFLGDVTSSLASSGAALLQAVLSGVQHVFNLTNTLTSTAVSGVVAPHVPGDYWAFWAAVATGGGAGFSRISLSLINPTTQLNPFNSEVKDNLVPTSEWEDAYIGLTFSIFAAVVLVIEYLVSLVLPTDNAASSAVEMGLTVIAEILAFIGLGMSATSLFSDTPGESDNPLVTPIGEAGLVSGVAGMVLGGLDLITAYDDS